MKSERRHELQQNYLADYLGHWINRLEPYAKSIGIGIAALVIALIGFGFYRSSQLGARSDATLELLQNANDSDPEALGLVGQRYAGTTAGALAKLYQGDALLASGIAGLFEDREEAEGRLADAIKLYEEIQGAGNDPLVRSRANLGLARAHESLGQVDQALAAYNRLVEINESEAIVKLAQQRIAQLKTPMTEEFLVWFAKQDFRPPTPAVPPGMPGADSLPDMPNFDLPDLSSLIPSTPLPTEPGDETAAEMTAPTAEDDAPAAPADESPAETRPGEPKPADEPAPADESTAPEPSAPAEPTTPAEPPASPEPAAPTEPAADADPPASEESPKEEATDEPSLDLNPPAEPESPAVDPTGSPE